MSQTEKKRQAAEKQPKETDAIKRKFESYGELQRSIDNNVQRLKALEASVGSISSPDMSGMPRGGGDGTSEVERFSLKKDELERKIERLRQKERRLLDELLDLIDQLKKPDEQTVMEMHYIDCMRWWPICAALYSSMPDYEENAEKYLKKAFKVHGSALQVLAKIYKVEETLS